LNKIRIQRKKENSKQKKSKEKQTTLAEILYYFHIMKIYYGFTKLNMELGRKFPKKYFIKDTDNSQKL